MLKTWNQNVIVACNYMTAALRQLNAAGNPYCEQRDDTPYGMLSNALRETLNIMLPAMLVDDFYSGLVFEYRDMAYLLVYYKLVD